MEGKGFLSGIDWSGKDLSGVQLQGKDLSESNLSGANLLGANLSGADLRGVNLCGANLCEAFLDEANLNEADLSEAFLSGAKLLKANLSGTDLHEADLSGADLRGANLDWDAIPLVPNIDAVILDVIEAGGQLDMNRWHTCETTHCRAGWAVVLAGDAGRKLEQQFGTNAAAALIYTKSDSHPVPNWYADNKTALEDIKARAEHQLVASQLISPEEKGIKIGYSHSVLECDTF